MATVDEIYPRKLDLARVAERTVWVLGRQPAIIFGLALVLQGIPTAGSLILVDRWIERADPFAIFHHPSVWGVSLVSMFIAAFMEASLLAVAFGELGGRRANLTEVLTTGMKFLLPLFAVNLFYFLGVAAGCIALVVPGILLGLAWCVAGPALVVERSGITAVFGRSAELTRNNRWRLLGLFLIFGIANAIIQGVAGGHSYMGGPFGMGDWLFSPLRVLISAVLSSLAHGVGLVGLGVIYVELRTLREGEPPADLERVFD